MSTRILRACVLAVGLITAGAFVPAAYGSGPLPDGTFLVCGRNSTAGSSGCISLQAAIDKATPISGTVTIEMMPGDYCPPTFPNLRQVYWSKMDFVGIGLAAYGPSGAPTSFTGPEAELTKFSWSSACGASVPPALVQAVDSGLGGQIDLYNLTVEGSSTGPGTGIYVRNDSLTLRDVIVENLTGSGVDVTQTSGSFVASIQNSSIAHNTGVGLSLAGAVTGGTGLSVQQSTVANNGVGIAQSGNLGVSVLSDTIAHNTTGFSGSTSQVYDTINMGNTTDCAAGNGWEGSSTNGHNLSGSTCPHTGDQDIVATGSIPAIGANGGPTYSILPPAQAGANAVRGFCSTYDQREYVRTSQTQCDIGSVESGSSSLTQTVDPYPAAGPYDFGLVAEGQQGGDLFRVYSTGAGIVFGYDVTLTGTGFTMVGDSCSHDALVGNQCSVGVLATPTPAHRTLTGTLTIKLSTGNLIYTLHAHGPDVTTLTAPSTATIGYGTTRTMTTTLTDTTTHKAVKNAKVVLQAKPIGTTAYSDVTTLTTSAAGVVTTTVKPRTSTSYRWHYAGSADGYSATSAAATVHVAQVVTAKLARTSVARHKTVTVTGSVSPKENGRTVTLQYRSGTSWIAHGTAVVHGATYTLHTTFATKGTRSLRITRAATTVNSAGVSPTMTLHTT